MNTLQKKVSVKDIAAVAGASLSTVNKALTGKPGISEKRRREIQKVARDMGYQVNSVAQIMSRNPITIGVVIPVPGDDMYYDIMKRGMETEREELEQYKVNVSYYTITSDEMGNDRERFLRWIREDNIEAVCFCPYGVMKNGVLLSCIIAEKVPLFLSGGGIEPPKECITVASVDAFLSGKNTVDFFHCIHGDNVRAAVIIDSMDTVISVKKVNSFKERLAEYGIEDVTILEDYAKDIDPERLEALLQEKPEINCIYVTTGSSRSVCEYLKQHGLQNRITLVGTDYYEGMKGYIQDGVMKATQLQNQEEIGRIIIRSAYDYLVKTRTFGNEDLEFPSRVYVKPIFCLKAYFE